MRFFLVNDKLREIAKQCIDESPDGYVVDVNKPTRSNEQNRLYWNKLKELGESTGFSSFQWHCYFKQEFLSPEVCEMNGKVVTMDTTTTKLTTAQFSDYVLQVEQWISENVEQTD